MLNGLTGLPAVMSLYHSFHLFSDALSHILGVRVMLLSLMTVSHLVFSLQVLIPWRHEQRAWSHLTLSNCAKKIIHMYFNSFVRSLCCLKLVDSLTY